MARAKNADRIAKEAAEAAAKVEAAAKPDTRSPAEIRTAEYRVAAQRETVEAFVVAFILALLFRAFLAEAFVIPTGSMAPTLMGAHKDLVCDRCSQSFQVGASRERNGPQADVVVVGGICPNCRHVNSLDLENDADDVTFNGDRILVSKFKYMLSEPERWDVIVFKYPGNPKQNYIKRLVGLPTETLTLSHGDVYAHTTGTSEKSTILRKPPSTVISMSQLVYDTDHQSESLIKANFPSRWQPWADGAESPPEDSWKVDRTTDGLTATVKASDDAWLRYFHHWPTDQEWEAADNGKSLASVDPYQGRAITDFYAYDSYIQVPAGYVYEEPPSVGRGGFMERLLNGGYSAGEFNSRYTSGGSPEQFRGAAAWGGQDTGRQELGRDGMHWVGDLIFESDFETNGDAKLATLELVEAGVKYQCQFDLSSGKATLSIIDGDREREFSGGKAHPSASTKVKAGTRHTIRISNFDDQILLWVDDDVIEFDSPTTYDARDFRNRDTDHPYWTPEHPLDAAPVGIAVRGGEATIRHMEIRRDKYYIATKDSSFGGIYDYDMSELFRMAGGGITFSEIQSVFAMPDRWSEFVGWSTRREVSFELGEDQFFPMGDNSPESLDARCWAGTKDQFPLPRGVNEDAWQWATASYVPRDLLVGKALIVFWPHSWNTPVPFTPNFKRMKIIR